MWAILFEGVIDSVTLVVSVIEKLGNFYEIRIEMKSRLFVFVIYVYVCLPFYLFSSNCKYEMKKKNSECLFGKASELRERIKFTLLFLKETI